MEQKIDNVIYKINNLSDLVNNMIMKNSQINGLLLSCENIENIQYLLNCAKCGIIIFIYDYNWSFDQFNKKFTKFIKNKNIKLNSLEICGWIFHGPFDNKLFILNNLNIDLNVKTDFIQLQPFIDIIKMIKPYLLSDCRLDLFACDIGHNNYFVDFLNFIEKIINIKIAYSNNITGNINNSDWVLEKYNINLLDMYFDKNMINKLKDQNISISFMLGENFGSTGALNSAITKQESLTTYLTTNRNEFKQTLNNIVKTYINSVGPLGAAGFICDILSLVPPPVGTIAGLGSTAFGFVDMGIKLANGETVPASMIIDNIVCGCMACSSVSSAATKINKMINVGNTTMKATRATVTTLTGASNGISKYMGNIFKTFKLGSFYDKASTTYEYIRILEGVTCAMSAVISSTGENVVIPGRLQLACDCTCYLYNTINMPKNNITVNTGTNENIDKKNILSYLLNSIEQYYGSGIINGFNNQEVINKINNISKTDIDETFDCSKYGYDVKDGKDRKPLDFFYGKKDFTPIMAINNIRLNPKTVLEINGKRSYVNTSDKKSLFLSFKNPIRATSISFNVYKDSDFYTNNKGIVIFNGKYNSNELNPSNIPEKSNDMFVDYNFTETYLLYALRIETTTNKYYSGFAEINGNGLINSITLGPNTYLYNVNNNTLNLIQSNDTLNAKTTSITTTEYNTAKTFCVSCMFSLTTINNNLNVNVIYDIPSKFDRYNRYIIGPYTQIVIKKIDNTIIDSYYNDKNTPYVAMFGSKEFDKIFNNINANISVEHNIVTLNENPLIKLYQGKFVVSQINHIVNSNLDDSSKQLLKKYDFVYQFDGTKLNSNINLKFILGIDYYVGTINGSIIKSSFKKNFGDNVFNPTIDNIKFVIGLNYRIRLYINDQKILFGKSNILNPPIEQVNTMNEIGNGIISKLGLQSCIKITKNDMNVQNAILTPITYIVLFATSGQNGDKYITYIIDVICNDTENYLNINFKSKISDDIGYKNDDDIYIGITNDRTNIDRCIYKASECLLYQISLPLNNNQFPGLYMPEADEYPFFVFEAKRDKKDLIRIAEPPNNGFFASDIDKLSFTTNGKPDYQKVYNTPNKTLIAYGGVTAPEIKFDMFKLKYELCKGNLHNGNIYCLFPKDNYVSVTFSSISPILPAGRKSSKGSEKNTTITLYKHSDKYKDTDITYIDPNNNCKRPCLNETFITNLKKVRTVTLKESKEDNSISFQNVIQTQSLNWYDILLPRYSSRNSTIVTNWMLSDDYYNT